ncbi:unnamed protein product [Owenia fusiformis]|uniref:Uncharacterized protein n=1 Tax=Owenia fusiformis TaxID=6347 RepID=A0A8J1UJE7_OWEFU|nr:unnamed protein product [Owenia fusiformis]
MIRYCMFLFFLNRIQSTSGVNKYVLKKAWKTMHKRAKREARSLGEIQERSSKMKMVLLLGLFGILGNMGQERTMWTRQRSRHFFDFIVERKERMMTKPSKIPWARINYLYQAAHEVVRTHPNNTELVRQYITNMISIARKHVFRIEPSIKRTICKKCFMLLIPGVTATVRTRSKREKHMVLTCLECKSVKRFLLRGSNKLWTEHPEAWVKDPNLDKVQLKVIGPTPPKRTPEEKRLHKEQRRLMWEQSQKQSQLTNDDGNKNDDSSSSNNNRTKKEDTSNVASSKS